MVSIARVIKRKRRSAKMTEEEEEEEVGEEESASESSTSSSCEMDVDSRGKFSFDLDYIACESEPLLTLGLSRSEGPVAGASGP